MENELEIAINKNELEIAINNFVFYLQEKMDKHYTENFPSLTKPTVKIEFGNKWCKLIKTDGASKSMYAFIAMKTFSTKELGSVVVGDIHKPASYNNPAKHARGDVFNETTWNCANPYGIEYLRGPSLKF
jgi:hypothetical protein